MGTGNWSVDEALQLSRHAAQTTLVCPEPALASTKARRLRLASVDIKVIGDGSTTAPSLFAAGDVTHVRDGFVSEAIAEGVRAGTAASVFLQRAASR